jgi:hypothetical protein
MILKIRELGVSEKMMFPGRRRYSELVQKLMISNNVAHHSLSISNVGFGNVNCKLIDCGLDVNTERDH